MENPEITLSEYWRIIRKRRLTIIFVFIISIFSTLIFTKLQTPIYQAHLEIKIEKKQSLISIGTKEHLQSASDGTSTLATEIRLINSLPVMRRVVEKMEVLPSNPEDREKTIHSLSLNYQRRTTVEQIAETNIIIIKTQADDSQESALMASAIADVYIIENIEGRKKQSKALVEYIDKQLIEYKTQLSEQEIKLQKFNQNEKVFEVTPEIKETLDRLNVEETFEFESEMLTIEAELQKMEKVYNEKIKDKLFEPLKNNNLSSNYIFIGLKRRLLELEFERFLLLIDYTKKHPEVIKKEAVINELKNKIVSMLKNYSRVPIPIEAEGDIAFIIKQLFLENRRDVLYRIVNRFYGDTGSLSSNQLEYVRLKRNIDRILNSYDTLLEQETQVKLDLAKVIDDVVTIVSPAIAPRKPIRPNVKVNLMVSSALGLLMGIFFGFIKESVDTSVSTISDVEHDLKLSILGIVPHIKSEEVLVKDKDYGGTTDKKLLLQKARLVTITSPKSWPAESLKMIRTNIVKIMKAQNLKTILFTSSDKQEGKSTIVTNTVLSLAQLGKKTLLIGSNLRRPTAYKIFGLNREPGLSDILMGNVSWKDVINNSTDVLTGGLDVDDLLQIPGIDNLKIITCGRAVDNVSELLNSKAYENLLRELKDNFDVIIIDCSPVMAVPDAITLSDKVDGVIMIYKVGQTPKDVLKMAKSNLLNANANLLGIVLNNIKTEAQVGYSAYYYRYYSEDDKKKSNAANKWKEQLTKEEKEEDDNIISI